MPEAVAENAQIKEAALTLQLSSYLPNQGVNRRGMLINQLHRGSCRSPAMCSS